MTASRSGLYDDPLVYDVLHAPGTGEEVDGLIAIERRFVPMDTPRLWLEPACGTGRYLREAAARGIAAIGFDLREGMIEYARERTPAGAACEWFVGDMTDFARRVGRRRVSLAFNLINTIRHLPSDEAMLAHLAEVERVLAPGGAYIVGLSLTAYGRESPSEDVWTGARGRLRVTQVVQYLPPRSTGNPKSRSELVVSHLVLDRPTGVEHRDSSYRLRTYSLEQFRALVERSPLRIEASVDELGADAAASDGGYALLVLTRP